MSPTQISLLATAYFQSHALLSAAEVSLFDHLPGSAEGVARSAGLDPRLTRQLLLALVSLGVVELAWGEFRLPPEHEPLLRSSSPTSLLPALRFSAQMARLWLGLPEALRSGRPVLPPTAHLGQDPARTRGFALAMHARALALFPPVADALDLRGARTLLDLGSGPGALARLLAERHPGLHLTLLDLPPISAIAAELLASHPAASRFRHIPGDYRQLPPDLQPGPDTISPGTPDPGKVGPDKTSTSRDTAGSDRAGPDKAGTDNTGPGHPGFDAVVFCGALHQHPPEEAGRLIAGFAGLLAPGGGLHLIDFFTDPSPSVDSPPFPFHFALNMSLVSPSAHTHSLTEARGYLEAAGLTGITHHAPVDSLYQILSARRR